MPLPLAVKNALATFGVGLASFASFDALAKIADHQPDIVFVDIMMPRLDGYQTCSLIKHNRTFRDTPVIMLSSKDGLFDRARGRIVGSEQAVRRARGRGVPSSVR